MNTNGYERGAMTGSSTTTTSDSVPWVPVLTTSRPLTALEAAAAAAAAGAHALQPAPLPPDRLPHPLLPPPLAAPSVPPDSGIFRQPPSPASRLFPHEQYPPVISSSASVFAPSALYPPLTRAAYYPPPPTGFATAGPSLTLAGSYPPQLGPYAELLARMRHSGSLPSSASRPLSGSSQDMHLPPPSLGTLRSSAAIRHPPLSSHPAAVAAATASRAHRDDRSSRSPDDRELAQRHDLASSSSSPFRHPILPPPSHRTHPAHTARGDGSISAGVYERSLMPRPGGFAGPATQTTSRVPTHSQSGFVSDYHKYLDQHARTYHSAAEGSASKRLRMSEGSARSPPLFHSTHSARQRSSLHSRSVTSPPRTATVATSLSAATSAQLPSPRGGGSINVTSTSPPAVTSSAQPHYPPHFMKGSIIQLANGDLKRIEELRTEDFVGSADISPDLKIDSSQVVHVEERAERGTVILGFTVGEHKLRVTVEATLEHPFFVFGRGWSSCSPERTLQRYGLQCFRLVVGDICISLTQRQRSSSNSSNDRTKVDSTEQHTETARSSSPAPHASDGRAQSAARVSDITGQAPAAGDSASADQEKHSHVANISHADDGDDDDDDVIVDRDSDVRPPTDMPTQQQQQALSGSRDSANESASSSTLYVSVDSPGSSPPVTNLPAPAASVTVDDHDESSAARPQSPAAAATARQASS